MNTPLLAAGATKPSMPLALYMCVLWALPGAFQFGYASVSVCVRCVCVEVCT